MKDTEDTIENKLFQKFREATEELYPEKTEIEKDVLAVGATAVIIGFFKNLKGE